MQKFDFDLGLSNHDPIGRIVVNLANFQPNTEYTLKYNLFPSSNVTDRNAAGSIRIRLRVEYDDLKKSLLKTLQPIPKMHINVRKEKSLPVLRYTCFGERGEDNEFDLETLNHSKMAEESGWSHSSRWNVRIIIISFNLTNFIFAIIIFISLYVHYRRT